MPASGPRGHPAETAGRPVPATAAPRRPRASSAAAPVAGPAHRTMAPAAACTGRRSWSARRPAGWAEVASTSESGGPSWRRARRRLVVMSSGQRRTPRRTCRSPPVGAVRAPTANPFAAEAGTAEAGMTAEPATVDLADLPAPARCCRMSCAALSRPERLHRFPYATAQPTNRVDQGNMLCATTPCRIACAATLARSATGSRSPAG